MRFRFRLIPVTLVATTLVGGIKLGQVCSGAAAFFGAPAAVAKTGKTAPTAQNGTPMPLIPASAAASATPPAAAPMGPPSTPPTMQQAAATDAAGPATPPDIHSQAQSRLHAAKSFDNPTQFSRADISLLQDLTKRRRELDQREQTLDMREKLLTAMSKRLDAKIAEMRTGEGKTLVATLPATLHALSGKGVQVVTTYSQAPLIQRSIHTLTGKLLEESLAVALISLLFLLRARSALVALVALPLGILAAFLIMWALGIPANIMSTGGIAIAIGVMMDAPVVMIENMHKHLEQTPGVDPWAAAMAAAEEVGPALFFSLIIIAVSFLPVFALGGEEGKLFAPLAFTKTFSVAAAAMLSITVVPILMAWFIRGRILPENRNPLNRLSTFIYRPVIHAVLRAPWIILVLALLLTATLYYPWNRLGSQFMPPLNEGSMLYMPIFQDPAISVGEAAMILQQTDLILKTFPEVKTVFGQAGRAQTATDQAPLSMFDTTVTLKEPDQWPVGMTMHKLQNKVNKALRIPGLSNVWTQPIKNRVDMVTTGLTTPLGIKVEGPNLDTLNRLGQKLQVVLQKVPGTQSAYAARITGGRYIVIHTDRAKAARYGLSVADVNRLVETAIGGEVLTTAVQGLERFPVDLRYPRELRQSLSTLMESRIATPDGAQIPLAQVADLRIEGGSSMLTSDNSRLNNWIYIDLKPGTNIGAYVPRAKAAIAKAVHLPGAYTLSWVGQYQVMERAAKRLELVIPAVILVIALLLYFNFRNWVEVAIILLTLPLSLVGGFWLTYWLGYKLSVAVAVGFIALAGVAVEFGVVMLLYLDQALIRRQARDALQSWHDLQLAVIEGTMLRLRPLAMTFNLVVGGLLPIMFSHGAGADVMKRIVAPMVGGVVTSVLMEFTLYPVIYYLWRGRELKKSATLEPDGVDTAR